MRYAICITNKTIVNNEVTGVCSNLIVGKIYEIVDSLKPINSEILYKINDGTDSWNTYYYDSDKFKLITRKDKLKRIFQI